MDADEPQFLEVGEGRKRRRIAYRLTEVAGSGPAEWPMLTRLALPMARKTMAGAEAI